LPRAPVISLQLVQGETAMADKQKKRDLRDGMLERGPVAAGNGDSDERDVPLDYDTTDIVRPDSREPEGQTTRQ
jgi:hypothetical protein